MRSQLRFGAKKRKERWLDRSFLSHRLNTTLCHDLEFISEFVYLGVTVECFHEKFGFKKIGTRTITLNRVKPSGTLYLQIIFQTLAYSVGINGLGLRATGRKGKSHNYLQIQKNNVGFGFYNIKIKISFCRVLVRPDKASCLCYIACI